MKSDIQKLLTTLIHDLGAPLRAGAGFPKLILSDRENVLSDAAKKWLLLIETQSNHGIQRIQALSRYTKLLDYKAEFSILDLNKLLADIVRELQENEDRTILFTSPELPTIMADHDLTQIGLHEIIKNCVQHSNNLDDTVSVSLRYSVEGEILKITISNNGFTNLRSASDLDLYLDPFISGAKATSGMGLTIAKKAFCLQEIALSLDSDKSTFMVNLEFPPRNKPQ